MNFYIFGAINRVQSAAWAGYAACVWMLVFAAMSFYWALGGTVGLTTVSLGQELAGEPWFIRLLWLTGILMVAGGLLALALVQSWDSGFRGGCCSSLRGVRC